MCSDAWRTRYTQPQQVRTIWYQMPALSSARFRFTYKDKIAADCRQQALGVAGAARRHVHAALRPHAAAAPRPTAWSASRQSSTHPPSWPRHIWYAGPMQALCRPYAAPQWVITASSYRMNVTLAGVSCCESSMVSVFVHRAYCIRIYRGQGSGFYDQYYVMHVELMPNAVLE